MEFKNIAQKDYNFDGIKLHNPTISELADVFSDEEDFYFVLKLFNTSLFDLFDTSETNITEFQIFQVLLITPQQIEDFTINKKKSIIDFLLILFKDYEFNITGNSIMFTKEDNIFILNDRNFVEFKNCVSKMFGTEEFLEGKNDENNFNPVDARAQAIADKIMRGRQKAAEEKGQTHNKGIIENYISILSVGLKIPPFTLCELTFYNLIQEYKRFVAKVEWELDIKQRLAGGEPQESPDFWMKYY
jgi:hypothetical protein